jgi:putative phage-type endonuclease
MKIHELAQGSPEWHAHRATHFNASDAPAMMGVSPYKTRTDLLHEMHTGLVPEVDAATQCRFDDGHRYEALARPLAVQIIGEDLYPITGSSGKYSASFDGLTITDEIVFEHKSLNDELRDVLPKTVEGGTFDAPPNLPKLYRIQMEQQLMISGAVKCLFMASKWNGDTLVEERHCWYMPDDELRYQIIASWEQFAHDLKEYQPAPAAPVVMAAPVQALPAVLVQVTGEITVRDNFKVFETALRDFIEHRLIREPKTDQDFADLELQIKAMKAAEEALDSAEAQMLAQVQAVDMAKKTKDMLRELTTENRIMAEKLVKSEKERRRGEIVQSGVKALAQHIDALNERIGKVYMPINCMAADFAGAIKGMKSMSSMENAVATELARAKIEANAVADRIQVNLNYLAEDVPQGHAFLFADLPTIVLKANDDFRAVVDSRIAAHKEKRERDEAETRERIRKEEQDRIAREAVAAASSPVLSEKSVADQNASAFVDAVEAVGTNVASAPAGQPTAPESASVPKLATGQVIAPSGRVVEPLPHAPSPTRAALNNHLDALNEPDLKRVLSFVQSRFPMPEAQAA